MSTVTFTTKSGENIEVENVNEGSRLLAVAVRSKQDIRYGCSSGKCGTCAIEVKSGCLSEMKENEKELLTKMKILDESNIRLACQGRIEGDVCVDLNYQDKYDPSAFGFE